MNTVLREAFLNAKVKKSKDKSLTTKCVASLLNNVGVKRDTREWSANLTTRTLKKLQSEGVFS